MVTNEHLLSLIQDVVKQVPEPVGYVLEVNGKKKVSLKKVLRGIFNIINPFFRVFDKESWTFLLLSRDNLYFICSGFQDEVYQRVC